MSFVSSGVKRRLVKVSIQQLSERYRLVQPTIRVGAAGGPAFYRNGDSVVVISITLSCPRVLYHCIVALLTTANWFDIRGTERARYDTCCHICSCGRNPGHTSPEAASTASIVAMQFLEIVRRRRLKGKQYPEDAGGSETVLIALTVGHDAPSAAPSDCVDCWPAVSRSKKQR